MKAFIKILGIITLILVPNRASARVVVRGPGVVVVVPPVAPVARAYAGAWDATHNRYVTPSGQYVHQGPGYTVTRNPDGSIQSMVYTNAAGGTNVIVNTGNGSYVMQSE